MAMPEGRFIEQMVGVARVSDLTIFWALLAVFAAVLEAMQATTDETASESRPRQSRELSAWHTPRVTKGLSAGWQTLFGLAVVACLVKAFVRCEVTGGGPMPTPVTWLLLLPIGLGIFTLVWWDLTTNPLGEGVDGLQTHPNPDAATIAPKIWLE